MITTKHSFSLKSGFTIILLTPNISLNSGQEAEGRGQEASGRTGGKIKLFARRKRTMKLDPNCEFV